jgi:alkylation response protein AidB-like acyl-CoA dehydrogenase
MMTGMEQIARGVDEIGRSWRAERSERMARRHLESVDFAQLREAGLLGAIVPREHGGAWVSTDESARALGAIYRALAGAEPSVALVSVMHPSVLCYWLQPPDPGDGAWTEQRNAVFASAVGGAQWATITSEPGSGGDIARTRAVAEPADVSTALPGHTYRVSGDKHFGSGSGIADHMVTTAVAAGDDGPAVFVVDVGGVPWDGSAGLRLIAEWDGMGMTATQSHAMRLEAVAATRLAHPGPLEHVTGAAGPMIFSLFTAVVLGVLDEAVGTARAQLADRADSLRPFEQVEWTRAEQEHWLAVQAYEGAIRAVECADSAQAMYAALRAKQSVADLAESVMQRLTRVIGGGTFSHRSPFAHWFEDVRALGFLRPPWGLATDMLLATSWEAH